MYDPNVIFNPDTAVSYYIFCFASLEILLRQFCKNFENSDFPYVPPEIFAAILRLFSDF